MLRHRLSVCVSVGRQESKSFGDRVRQHRWVFLGQKPARTSFSYLICLENKKQTAPQKKKVSRCVMQRKFSVPAVAAMQSSRPTPHVVSPREKAIERFA